MIPLIAGELKQVNVSLSPVSAIPVAIVMQGVNIRDITSGEGAGDPGAGPVTIPLGHAIHPMPHGVNNTDTEVMFDLHCWCVAPSGKKAGELYIPLYNKPKTGGVLPGGEFGGSGVDFVLDETGIWHYIEKIEFIPESPVVPVVEGDWPIEVV